MPVFSKPVQPTSTANIPRSSRKRTLNPKLSTEDNVHPEATKRRKLEEAKSTSKSSSNKNPARNLGGSTLQVKSHGRKVHIEDDDEDIIMNDNEDEEEEEKDNEEEEEKNEEENDDDELQEENDESELEDDVESQEELDRKELGMLHPPFGIHLLNYINF